MLFEVHFPKSMAARMCCAAPRGAHGVPCAAGGSDAAATLICRGVTSRACCCLLR